MVEIAIQTAAFTSSPPPAFTSSCPAIDDGLVAEPTQASPLSLDRFDTSREPSIDWMSEMLLVMFYGLVIAILTYTCVVLYQHASVLISDLLRFDPYGLMYMLSGRL